VDGSKPQYGSVALTTACFLPLCSRCVCGAIERKTPDHYWIGGPVNVPPGIGLVPGLTTGYMGVMRAQRAALFRIASSSQPVKPGHNSGTPPMPTYGAEMHPVQYTGSEEIYYRYYSRVCGWRPSDVVTPVARLRLLSAGPSPLLVTRSQRLRRIGRSIRSRSLSVQLPKKSSRPRDRP